MLRSGTVDQRFWVLQAHAHGFEDLAAQLQVRHCIEIARPGQVDVDDRLNRGRPPAHDHHAVGQLHRLVDVVRDEQHRLAFAAARCAPGPARILSRVRKSSAPNGSSM